MKDVLLSGTDKEQMAILRLQDAARLSEHRYKKPLMVTYSGGMDVFRWWMEDDNISGQLSMDELLGGDDD